MLMLGSITIKAIPKIVSAAIYPSMFCLFNVCGPVALIV